MVVFDRDLEADVADAIGSQFATNPAQNVPSEAEALPSGVHGEPIDATGVPVACHSDRSHGRAFKFNNQRACRVLRQTVSEISRGLPERGSQQSRKA